ncbi:interleukin-31 receptor subunit alpha-like isoform X2 [Morone saxatilis]|uniref:interleukin-31 receptor subunit alpha-like isoform X2 n=1 Tax=Morone saxatilis TaxID=34816 RepID=UPI0015E24C18|nr:interleukin-31 receptor subunit alpha-like isoform X2 [Morone saxatilis]
MYSSLAVFILIVTSSICKGQNVFPKDPYIEVGSSINIVCQNSVQGKIYWTLNSERINESWSNTNSSHSVLSLPNFTHSSATLQCHSANTQVLGGTIIRTYTKPSNISCILTSPIGESWFICTWEHQTDSSLNINYTVMCNSCSNLTEICNSQETTCKIKYVNISAEIGYVGNFNISVRAKHAAWEAFSEPQIFKLIKIVKINPPELTITTVSDHLLLEWKVKKKDRCQVKYSTAGSESTPEVPKNLAKVEKQWITKIENVESCSNYTVAVRCALGLAPWSDWSREQTVLTKLNQRDVKLHLWRNVAEADKNQVRKVHAMWTEIPSTCQETLTYTIKQTPYKQNMTGVDHMETSCDNSICDVNQDAHRINLKVFLNESLFVNDSVYVPAIGESLPRVTDIQTSTFEGAILVSWKAPQQPVSGYMIDYTHNGNQYSWKETKYTNATLFDLLDKKPYNITVTPLFEGKTGHGTQALQICSRVGDPGDFTNVNVQAKHKSAFVSWGVKSQEACRGAVVNYIVFYSTQDGPQLNVTVDNTTQHISLKDLNPNTQYRVYVKAVGHTGTTKSSERLFETKRFDPALITALSVCGSILIVLVLSVGLCCAIQWKRFQEKPVPNPGNSSVGSWRPMAHGQGIWRFQPLSYPQENIFNVVDPEEVQRTSTSPLTPGCHDNPASDQTEEYTDPVLVTAPDIQSEDAVEHEETQHPESTELLSSEGSPSSPYRSQSSVETAARTSEPCKCVSLKQPDKTPPVTIYVTLDMFG